MGASSFKERTMSFKEKRALFFAITIPLMWFVALVGCNSDKNKFKTGDLVCSINFPETKLVVVGINGSQQVWVTNDPMVDSELMHTSELEYYDADLKNGIVLDEPKLKLDKMSIGDGKPMYEKPVINVDLGEEAHIRFNKHKVSASIVTTTGDDEAVVILKVKKQ
jgi:hypothetical protein